MASIFKPGLATGVSPNPSRPASRSNHRSTDDGGLVKRTDSSRSMVDTAANEQKAGRNNIKVAVRIRPLSDKERGRGDQAVWATDGLGGVGLTSARNPSQLNIKYAYDQVFDMTTSNEQVFEHVGRPTIEPVVQGISGTVFAYGVTSSGKTHTMMGTQTDPGVVPRSIAALFDLINQTPDRSFSVTFTMMEIYCEMLNDLLDPSKLNLDVQEKELPNGKGSILLVKNLTEGKVASAEAALALIQQGQDNRKVGTTAFNDQSSRSHTLCRFLVESCPAGGSPGGNAPAATTRTSAWLTLVDLAGSEGAKAALSKDQQAEARDINRSLLTLGKVVYELAKGGQAGHVPFRDSLLTRLLKPSLTGNGAKVAIICNVTPASSQSEETWNTLRFADGAKRIKVAAVKNEALDVAAVVAQYQREVEALKAQLAALTGAAAAGGGSLSPAVLQAMQATWASSSQANEADQLADQEAQLHHLQESNAVVVAERDQLLAINRRMVGLLVQQIKDIVSSNGTDNSRCSGSSNGVEVAGAASLGGLAKHRRCLSFESMQYYRCWRDSQTKQQRRADDGSELDSLGSAGLIRLSEDSNTATLLDPANLTLQSPAAVQGHSSAVPGASRAGSQHSMQLFRQGSTPNSVPTTVVPQIGPVVPGSIYFPGNRRTSKTLALAVPGISPMPLEGVTAASWLGPVATASAAAAAAAGCSAVTEAVEAHRKLSAARERLDVLVQQLDDKEALLKEARQMQEAQTLQLRLTITAADRALLRDKLAEAEQQLASYQSVLKEYEAEKEELYDTAYSLYGKVQKLTEQNHAAAAEMQQLKARLTACFSGTSGSCAAAGAGAGIGSGFISPRKAMLTSPPPDPLTPSGIPAAAITSNQSAVVNAFVRPKSATPTVGQRSGFAGTATSSASPAAGGGAGMLTSRYGFNSALQSRSNSIGRDTISAVPAAGAISSSQSMSVGDFNPICISSPFSNEAELPVRHAVGRSSPTTTNNRPSCSGSPISSGQTAGISTGRASPTLLSSALNTGTSRIPMPPCLQQRPKQLGSDNMLFKLGMFQQQQHSKLPSAPSSNCSSNAASGGGAGSNGGSPFATAASCISYAAASGIPSASSSPIPTAVSNLNPASRLPPAGNSGVLSSATSESPNAVMHSMHSRHHSRTSSAELATVSGGTAGSLTASASATSLLAAQRSSDSSGSSSRKQVLLSAGSPLVAPVNRLKSQPGLLAVAAAAAKEVGSGEVSSTARVLAAGVADAAGIAPAEGAESTAAATAMDLQQLWAALPQTQTANKADC